jgi:hypothetical protein
MEILFSCQFKDANQGGIGAKYENLSSEADHNHCYMFSVI